LQRKGKKGILTEPPQAPPKEGMSDAPYGRIWVRLCPLNQGRRPFHNPYDTSCRLWKIEVSDFILRNLNYQDAALSASL
ncbi:MAG: hypothetical protein ACFN4H_04555, partial [Prevotella sp.]